MKYILSVYFTILFLSDVYVESARFSNGSIGKRSDRVVFRDGDIVEPHQEIPLDLIKRLNDVQNVYDLFENFIEHGLVGIRIHPVGLSASSIADRNDEDVERKAVQTAKMAVCMPEMQTVPLRPFIDTGTTLYYPSCTRVERCGGCCTHSLLSCQPVQVELLQFQVVVTEYRGGNQLKYKGKEIVSVEQHTKCKCDCKVKAKDCNIFQTYHRQSCRCICNNTDEEKKCYEDSTNKLWDPLQCACVCRTETECSTGFYFDKYTCSCMQERGKRRKNNTTVDKFSYHVEN